MKNIAVLGSGANWATMCVSALIELGYNVLREGYDADGIIVFDIFPNEPDHNEPDHMEAIVAQKIAVPIFWVHLFSLEDCTDLKSMDNVIFEKASIGMDSKKFFDDLISALQKKVPL